MGKQDAATSAYGAAYLLQIAFNAAADALGIGVAGCHQRSNQDQTVEIVQIQVVLVDQKLKKKKKNP